MSQKIHNAKSLYLEGIRDGHARAAVEEYTGGRYTQHSTGVRDGKEGFVAFFEPFLERNPIRHIEVVRSFADGQYVFVHVYQSLNHGESKWVTMDFFDTNENDKIIEHWDVIAAFEGKTPSDHSQIDGETEIRDIPETEINKSLVKSMIEDLLMPDCDIDRVTDYIDQDYIEHSLSNADGIESFVQFLNLPNRPLWYHEIVLLVGCGNFVATLCRTTREGEEYAQTDLFRLQKGKVIEHWEAAEPVPTGDDLVNGGKF